VKPMKLRSHLLLLTVSALLPMVLFALVVTVVLARREAAVFERGATERTRALLTAVDAELKASEATLEGLAASRHLDTGDTRAFQEDASRVLRSQEDWLSIALASPTGQQVVNVLRPPGAALPTTREVASLERVLRTGKPAVGDVIQGAVTGEPEFSVRVPVARDGGVKYVLSASVKPRSIHALLASQRLPADWVGVVLDGQDRIVARTVADERSIGQLASDSLRAALARSPEGWFHGTTIEGAEVYTPYNRSPTTGWAVAMGIPAAVVEAGARRSMQGMAAGSLLAAALALAAALIVGQRIAGPIAHLAAAAGAVGRGERPGFVSPAPVQELNDVGRALDDAAAAVRAREEAQRQLAAIVRSSTDAIVGYGLDGRIMAWNDAATRTFGYSEAEAIGQSIDLIVPPERRGEEADILRRVANGVTVPTLETVRLHKDGARVDVALTISPVRDVNGVIVGASKIARDVGERKRVDQERARLLAAEQGARAEAEAANRAKDEFLAILSHELRTPLSAVYGWARMLQTGEIRAEAAQRALDSIVRNARAQVHLVDDLLDVSRVITGKMRLDVQPVDVAAVVGETLESVRLAAEAKDVRLQHVLDPRAGLVSGDPARLQQVVWNLLMNAVKFTPRGGRVHVRVERGDSQVLIVVSDTGQGIAPEVLPFVFDRFRQADSSSTRAHAGLGLGLALVKHLVEMHGGTVLAESGGDGKGATFVVRLPVLLADVRPAAAPRVQDAVDRPPARLPALARLDGLRVLVVDDDRDAVDLATAILTAAGATVRSCSRASEALEVLRQWRPAVLVSDIEMPEEDGLALIRNVRALPAEEGGATAAMALTGYGRIEDRMRSLAAGYTTHLSKPVDPAEFTAIVASLARA